MTRLVLVGEIATAVAAIVWALDALRRGALCAIRVVRHIDTMHDTVQRELMPNGGGALIDAVNRIDLRLAAVEARNVRATDAEHAKSTALVEHATALAAASRIAAQVIPPTPEGTQP